jgi:hypothetical protein
MEQITLRIQSDVLESIDSEAVEHGISRSEHIRNILQTRNIYSNRQSRRSQPRSKYSHRTRGVDIFLCRINDIYPDKYQGSHTTIQLSPHNIQDAPGPTDALRTARTAYRDSIMSVPHYDSEYGESFKRNLTAEFNQTIAICLVTGTKFTKPIQNALIRAVKQRRYSRERFDTELQKERRLLQRVIDSLSNIESRTHQIGIQSNGAANSEQSYSLRDELNQLEVRCGSLTEARQMTIHNRRNMEWAGVGSGSLVMYLYDDLPTRTPALSAIASCLKPIHRYQRDYQH